MSRTLSGLMSGDTDLTINVNLENITASNVVSGILDTARIPDLSSKGSVGRASDAVGGEVW